MSDLSSPPSAPVVWPADPGLFADAALCPACLTGFVEYTCPRCGFDTRAPEARAVRESALAVLAAEQGRLSSISAFHTADARRRAEFAAAAAAVQARPGPALPPSGAVAPAVAAAAPVAAPAMQVPAVPAPGVQAAQATAAPAVPLAAGLPPAMPGPGVPLGGPAHTAPVGSAPSRPRRSGVQLFLMIAGLSLLAIAALFFLVVAYTLTGVEGRILITVGIAVGVLALAAFLDRRRLDSTAGGLAILAAVVLAIAAIIGWTADGFGLRGVPLGLYSAIAAALVAVVFVVAAVPGRIRVAGVIAVLSGLVALASLGAWIGSLLFPGELGVRAALSTSMLGLVAAGPLSAWRRLPAVESTVMRTTALAAGVVAVVRVPLAPAPSAVVDVVLLACAGLLSLVAALLLRGSRGGWWSVGFLSLAALTLAVAPASAALRSDLDALGTASIAAIGAAVVAGAVSVVTARVRRASNESRSWWATWLPTVSAVAVLAIPILVLLPLASFRLVRTLAAGVDPWRLTAFGYDLTVSLPAGGGSGLVPTGEIVAAALTSAVALLLSGGVLVGIAWLAFGGRRTGHAIALAAASFLVVGLVPGAAARGILLALLGATGVVLLFRTRALAPGAVRVAGHLLSAGSAVALALSAPASVALFVPSALLAVLLFVAGAAFVGERPGVPAAARRWPLVLGAVFTLLWGTAWSLPFGRAVHAMPTPWRAAPSPVADVALVVAAAAAVLLVLFAALASRFPAYTRLAATVPSSAALLVSGLVVWVQGTDAAIAAVALGVVVLGVLWLALPATSRLPEAAALGALVPPALALGIFHLGSGDPLPLWSAVAAVMVVAAAASAVLSPRPRIAVQAATGLVALAPPVALALSALPNHAVVTGLVWLLTAITPVLLARTWSPLLGLDRRGTPTATRSVRFLAWVGLPFAIGALVLLAYGIAPDVVEVYGLPIAVVLAALALLIARREPLAETPTALQALRADAGAPPRREVGLVRTVLLIAALGAAILPTLAAAFRADHALARALALLTAGSVLLVASVPLPARWRGLPLPALFFPTGLVTTVAAGLAGAAGGVRWADGPVSTPTAYLAAVVCAVALVLGAVRSTARLWGAGAALAVVVLGAALVVQLLAPGGIVEPWSLLVAAGIAAAAVIRRALGVPARSALIAAAVVAAVVPTAVECVRAGEGTAAARVRLVVLLASAVVLLIGSRLVPARWRDLPLPGVLLSAGAAAAAAVMFAAAVAAPVIWVGGPTENPFAYTAFVLVAIAAVLADAESRLPALLIAGVAAVGGLVLWWRSGFGPVEPYSVVVGVVLVLLGLRALAHDPRRRTMPALGPGLALALVPSLVYDYTGTDLWRVVALGAASLGVLLWGLLRKWQAPFLIGGVVLVLHALAQTWPWIIWLYEATTVWLWIALGGALLVTIAATYEARIRNARSMARAIGSLR